MDKKQGHSDFDLSLLRKQDDRQIKLAKMRSKLAGRSQFETMAQEKRLAARRAGRLSWSWKIGLALALASLNGGYFLMRTETVSAILEKRAPVLAQPAPDLDKNRQALYWTYALYDFDRLKTTFGVPKMAIVDATQASTRLRELIPEIDARTRFIVEGYLPRPRRNS